VTGDFTSRCHTGKGNQHDGRGDPIVEAAFDIDQTADPRWYRRVGHHARTERGVGRRQRCTDQQRQPDASLAGQGERE
jgi:hypothetical protein